MLPETGVIPHTLCAGAPGSEPPETVSMQHSENTRLTERTACLQKQLSPGNLTAYHPTSPVHAQYETVHLHTQRLAMSRWQAEGIYGGSFCKIPCFARCN